MSEAELQESSTNVELTPAFRTGQKAYEFLDRTKFLELRKSDQDFENWMQNVTYDEFMEYVTRLNGILRDIPIHERQVDGSGVEISQSVTGDVTYLPPSEAVKPELMHEAFEALKNIPDNNDRAELLYYILQSVHPFADGNGRTGRLLHQLVSTDGKEITQEILSELLDHDKKGGGGLGEGRKVFRKKLLDPEVAYYVINREVVKSLFGDEFVKHYGGIYVSSIIGNANLPSALKAQLTPHEISQAEKVLGEGSVMNYPFRGLVLSQFLDEKSVYRKYSSVLERKLGVKETIAEDVGKFILRIDDEEIIEKLSKDDILRILEIHKLTKEKFIRMLIDVYAHPDAHQARVVGNQDIPVKNFFRGE